VAAETAIAAAQLTDAHTLADAQLTRTLALDAANATEQINNLAAANTAADHIEDASTTAQNTKTGDLATDQLANSDINTNVAEGGETSAQAASDTQAAQDTQAADDAAAQSTATAAVAAANQAFRGTVDTQASSWSTTMTPVDKQWEQTSADSQAQLTGDLADAASGLAAAEAQDLATEQVAQSLADQTLTAATTLADQTLTHSTSVAEAANAVAYAKAEGDYQVGRATDFANQLAAAALSSGDPLVAYQAAIAAAQENQAIGDDLALVAKETGVTNAEVAAGDQDEADQAGLMNARESHHVTLVGEEAPLEAQETADQADAQAQATKDEANATAAQTIADADAAIDDQDAVTQAIVQNDQNVSAGGASDPNPPAVAAAAATEQQAIADAAVTLATALGLAEVTLATSLAGDANTLAAQEKVFEDQAAGDDETSLVGQQNQDALAGQTETAAVGLTEADYQLALGNDAVTEAAAASGAEADFAIAQATRDAAAAQTLAQTSGSPADAFQAVYAQAAVDWLTDTRLAYITHGTALAQDEADYEHQLAVDQKNLADAEASEAVAVTAAESPLVANEVDGQATNDDAYSAALIAGQGQEAITLAEADQTQEVALANAKANFTGQAYTNAVADANLGWVQSAAGAEALAATDDATAEENDVTGDASLADGFAWSDAGQVDAQTKTDAAAEAGQAQNDVSADAARQNFDATAEVAFNTALYNETANQWTSIAASVPLPWTQYRAGLATAEAGWYTANSGLYTSYIGDQATAEINYSIDDAGKYLTEADNVADDQQTEAQKMADAALTAADTQAADQYTFTQSMSTAWSDEQTGTAQLQHDVIENGNWAAMNAALAAVKANWITGQSSALGTLETTDADAALVENQADLDAAKNEQEGTLTAELPQVEQYDDAESLANANEQKADDLARVNYQSTWSASHAAALAAFDQANPSPWAAEAAALAAANSTLQGSLATAQQTESDAEADVERQDETTQTDAETQFQESQVSNEHDLAWGQVGNADAQVGSDALALETGASQNPNFTASPAALAPPPGVASPPVGGGRYADYTSVSQWGLLSAYTAMVTPILSSYAAGNFSSWLGWNSASPAGGSLAAETPNLSGSGTSLSDAAFAALALLQGEVQVEDAAVRADDAFTDADGTGNLPPMNPTPPALTPPGTPPLISPSTPPTPMSLEAAAAAPAAPPASPPGGGGTGSTGGSTQQPATTGTPVPNDFSNPNNDGITDPLLGLAGTPFESALKTAADTGGVYLLTLYSGRDAGPAPYLPGASAGKSYIEVPNPADKRVSWPVAVAGDIGTLVDEGHITVEQGREAFDRLGTWLKANGWTQSGDGLSFTKNDETITRPSELVDRSRATTSDSIAGTARIRFSSELIDATSILGSPLPVSDASELAGPDPLTVSSDALTGQTGFGGGLVLNVAGDLGFTPWMSKPTLFGYDMSGTLKDSPSALFNLSTAGVTTQSSIFDTPQTSNSSPLVINLSPDGFMAIDAGMKTTTHAVVVAGGAFLVIEGGGAMIPTSLARTAVFQAGKQAAGRLLIYYGTVEGATLTHEGTDTLLFDEAASQEDRYAAYEKLYVGVPMFLGTVGQTSRDAALLVAELRSHFVFSQTTFNSGFLGGVKFVWTSEPGPSGLVVVPRPRMEGTLVTAENGNTLVVWGQVESSSTTAGHAEALINLVKRLTASGEYEYVTLQRAWRTATGRVAESSLRPDVIAVRKNGIVDAWEVISASDGEEILFLRLEEGRGTLPWSRQGEIDVIPPEPGE
jgi:hypothetical protein